MSLGSPIDHKAPPRSLTSSTNALNVNLLHGACTCAQFLAFVKIYMREVS